MTATRNGPGRTRTAPPAPGRPAAKRAPSAKPATPAQRVPSTPARPRPPRTEVQRQTGRTRSAGPPARPRRPSGHRAGHPRRRLNLLRVGMLVLALVVTGRLVQIQGVAADRYIEVGENQRVRAVTLPAERGGILDRDGRELALSVRQSTVWANPRSVVDPRAAAEALSPLLTVDVETLVSKLTRDSSFQYLARKVDDAVAAQVKELALPGVAIIPESERFLPSGDLAASLLGRVGLDNDGLSGLELQFEDELAGQPGRVVNERGLDGREIPGGVREFIPSSRGDDVVLTIDRSLQYETERALSAEIVTANAKGGMAIVMQTRTGEVLAMANLVAGEEGGPPRPADNNMAVTNAYEPGSVNKMITVSAALEEGLVQAEEQLTVPSTIKVADHVFREHDPHPTAQWSITDIVANSSNVGSIMIGQKLGKQRLDKYMRAFGFGKKTPLAFPGETAGIMLDPDKYSGTSMGTMPIGQGVAVTAMQMLAAYNTVANGGVYVAPKLVAATIDGEGERHPTAPSVTRRVISPRTAAQMTAMLNEVVRVGTGKLAAIEGYTVAGKTGTARKPLENARGYKEGAYVSSFAGFVPSERPELAVIVMLDEPTPIFGGLVAAPVFAEIARYALRQYRIPPPPPVPAAVAVPQSSPGAAGAAGDAGEAGSTAAAAAVPPSTAPAAKPVAGGGAKPAPGAPKPAPLARAAPAPAPVNRPAPTPSTTQP